MKVHLHPACAGLKCLSFSSLLLFSHFTARWRGEWLIPHCGEFNKNQCLFFFSPLLFVFCFHSRHRQDRINMIDPTVSVLDAAVFDERASRLCVCWMLSVTIINLWVFIDRMWCVYVLVYVYGRGWPRTVHTLTPCVVSFRVCVCVCAGWQIADGQRALQQAMGQEAAGSYRPCLARLIDLPPSHLAPAKTHSSVLTGAYYDLGF